MALYADALREQVEALENERAALVEELETLAPDDTDPTRTAELVEARATEIGARGAEIIADVATKVARIAELDAIRKERAEVPKSPNFIPSPKSADEVLTDRSAGPAQVRDSLLRSVADHDKIGRAHV